MSDPVLTYRVTEDVSSQGLYLRCAECHDLATGIVDGDTLGGLLAEAREHHDLYHADDVAPPAEVSA